MSVAVIQGASGSLGQALTRHILQHTNLSIYALTHQPASAQKDLKARILDWQDAKVGSRLTVLGDVDVRAEEGLERAAKVVKERDGKVVRLIACMAGVLHPEKSLSAIDPGKALDQFAINSLGHLLTYKHFVPLIPNKKDFRSLSSAWSSDEKPAQTDGPAQEDRGDPARGLIWSGGGLCFSMSARVGSIADNERGGWYSYRASKAAVNQIVRSLDHELLNKSSSALAIGYHPGTVLTPFTAPVIGDAKADPEHGRFAISQAIERMTTVMSMASRDGKEQWGGRCWDWRGDRIQW